MEKYEPVMSFDETAAEVYDDVSQRGDEMETVAFLEQLARGGPALELAIGTGRIALPLAARGIRVDGIDFSAAMISQLRAKPGGAQIAVTMGNFADVAVKGTYRLIYWSSTRCSTYCPKTSRSAALRMSLTISPRTAALW